MIRTRVGYSGGTKKSPTYHDLGDHTECFQVDFDPEVITYKQLVDLFWASHDPIRGTWCNQYKAILFYDGPDQEKVALASRDEVQLLLKGKMSTEVRPATTFWVAEDYHQKYELRQSEFYREFAAMYPDPRAFMNSTAAARVNGYVAGCGTREEVKANLDRLGLSPDSQQDLLRHVR